MMTCATAVLLCAGALLPEATPESQGVSSAAIAKWIDACERELDALHGFVLVRHGKVIAEGSWAPCDTLNRPHMLYSHSKSFTATAIGFLVDDVKLDLDERVVDILPDKAPAAPSENLKSLRVRDLLSMNLGARKTDAMSRDPDGDWERAILSNEIDRRPGQAFKYDSGASYLLSAIVTRKCGRPLMDFLRERLFGRLGIVSVDSGCSPAGIACGGWGMRMTTREIAAFGQLYLDRGVWKDERLLSGEWVDLATARQSWAWSHGLAPGDANDWHQGYGFQFWRCWPEGVYRADGSNGQLTIVMPRQDAVLSVHAGLPDMQKELTVIWRHLLPAFGTEPLPEDAAACAALRARCADLRLPTLAGGREGAGPFCGRDYFVSNEIAGIRSVRVDQDADGWLLKLRTEAGEQRVPVGCGVWRTGSVRMSNQRHESLGRIVGDQRVAATAAVSGGVFRVRMALLDGPQRLDLTFRRADGKVRAEGRVSGIGGGELAFGEAAVDPAAFGFDPAATPAVNSAALQKALGSGGRTVRCHRAGTYRLGRSVMLQSETTLSFAPGTVLVPEMPVAVFAARGISHVKISGMNCQGGPCALKLADFDDVTVEDFTLRGGANGIWLRNGRNFVMRNGVFRTVGDGLVLLGPLQGGTVESVVDEAGSGGFLARVVSGFGKDGSKAEAHDILFRDIRIEGNRAIACMWDEAEGKRIVPPNAEIGTYPTVSVRVENAVKRHPGPVVSGMASAEVVLDNVTAERGPVLAMDWIDGGKDVYPTVRRITVSNCTFRADSRMDLVLGDARGKAEVSFANCTGNPIITGYTTDLKTAGECRVVPLRH